MENVQYFPQRTRELTGLLTQTVLPSPVIQWILPARIRCGHHNDVVFVGQRRIQVKEASDRGFLDDVTEKSDFDYPIVGAKAINVNTELPWEAQLRTTIDDDSAEGAAYTAQDLPSQILVLSLEMRELQFLYYTMSGDKKFITYRRPLPVDVDLAERFGKHIAVDPKSRAIAVGASRHYFGLFLLKSSAAIQQQMSQQRLDPIKSESFFRCEGTIQFMEFLYPKAADDTRIILLVVTSTPEGSFARIYHWDDCDLRPARPNVVEFKLRKEDRLPTMIVPLTKESSFLVVTSKSMVVYPSDSTHPRPMKYPLIAPDIEFKETSLWTQWARPARNWLYSRKTDGIYMCREDGWIYFLEFGNEGGLESQTSLGQLHCDVDSAFDVLDVGHEGGDFILAAGSMGDGGLFIQEARSKPRCVQRFLNWAPVTDAVMIRAEKHGNATSDVSRDRLFVCSASSGSGGSAIHELRHGYEAQAGYTVSLDDFSGVRDMWAFSEDVNGGAYILFSHPTSALLLFMNPGHEDIICAVDESETGFENVLTLAAGFTPTGILIQATQNGTNFFVPLRPESNTSISHAPEATVVAVAIDDVTSSMVVAYRSTNGLTLALSRIVLQDSAINLRTCMPVQIEKEPVCLSLQLLGDTEFLFSGTSDGTITVFFVEQDTLNYLFETTVSVDSVHEISRAIDSFSVIRHVDHGVLRAHLLCGLRGGVLVPFKIDFNAPTLIGLLQAPPKQIGVTSVRLQDHGTFAMLVCDHELWQVTTSADGDLNDCFLSRVWITEQSNPAYFPARVHSFGLVRQESQRTAHALGPLFSFADNLLLNCSLSSESKIVPRRISVPGTARKMIYSPNLRKLLLAYDTNEAEDLSSPVDIFSRSCLALVHADTQEPVNPAGWPQMPRSSAGERILCMMDWNSQRDGNIHHFIAIGTSLPAKPGGSVCGRLILLHSPGLDSPTGAQLKTQHVQDFAHGPIRSIAAYEDTLLICSGKTLRPVASRGASIKWTSNSWIDLPSPAVTISVSKPFVHISTARHGFVILEVLNDGTRHSLKLRGYDSLPLEGLTHYVTPTEPSLAFISARGGSIRAGRLSNDTGLHTAPIFVPPAPDEAVVWDTVLKFIPNLKGDILPKTAWQRGGSVYGIALTGSVSRFTILREDERRLLLALQDLCQRDEALCSSLAAREKRRKSTWTDSTKDNTQINGDILVRLARQRADYLEERIQTIDHQRGSPVYDSFLRSSAQRVLGPSDNYPQQIVGWIRHLLHVDI
ncbi:Uncharacterized protein PECH_005778 [Penicillium ucsense]|uniref:RSE1/DDB1/CPSF1 first beta-propeller domain-containing protein n=1 Tax=Penicillium ucsense TaxID=2839758 RepID=A0A8J8WAJ1_9EURO|nr:Uncharacterized protein PECM_003232 [Penicillium ucsense]KAF7736081.1 Uncharacterized protein PECH_005778 [Penicillium ucsense]